MAVWKLTLSYDGGDFHGWQVQPGLPTVQDALAKALARLTGEWVLPQASGRTDAGVHALGQVVSFRLRAAVPPENLRRALNRALPAAIRVTTAAHAAERFHARYDAVRKTYQYRVFQARRDGDAGSSQVCDPMLARYVWDCPWRLSLEGLQAAAAAVLGEHDFTSFAACDPEKGTGAGARGEARAGGLPDVRGAVRSIEQSAWTVEHETLVYRVTGSGFLHHMVRNLVGTFVEIARGARGVGCVAEILKARRRAAAGPTAPARGLFLESVEYGASA